MEQFEKLLSRLEAIMNNIASSLALSVTNKQIFGQRRNVEQNKLQLRVLRCGTRQLQRARQHHSPPSTPSLAPSPRGAVTVVSLNQQKPPPSLPSLLAAQIDFLSSVNGLALAGSRGRKILGA